MIQEKLNNLKKYWEKNLNNYIKLKQGNLKLIEAFSDSDSDVDLVFLMIKVFNQ